MQQRSCLNLALILALIIALNSALLGTSAARSSAGDDISPIFRRKPYKSTTESSKIIASPEVTAEKSTSSSSSSSEEKKKNGNNFRVGAEHYYDNRIDIQKQNDDLDIKIEEDIDDEGMYMQMNIFSILNFITKKVDLCGVLINE